MLRTQRNARIEVAIGVAAGALGAWLRIGRVEWALLTTTMPYMKVVIDTLKERGIRNNYIVLVGGAPLNEEFGKAVGADAYCRDAAIAVETAKGLIAKRRAVALAN